MLQPQPVEIPNLQARIAVLEAALRGAIANCHTCHGSGQISSWNVNSGGPMARCPDCAFAREALKGDA